MNLTFRRSTGALAIQFRRFNFLTQAIALLLSVLLVLGNVATLMALPPLQIDLTDPDTVEISWPDTGESVILESSGDLNLFQPFPLEPVLSGGQFRQLVEIDPGSQFFRLSELIIDQNAPAFEQLPDPSPSLFPGQSISFTLSATDPNGLDITYLADPLPLPRGASLNTETGVFSWTPTEAQTGITTITFLAFNGNLSARFPVSINVEEPPADAETSLSGILLDTTNAVDGAVQPIVGAVVTILGTDATATTGADGRFTLPNIPGGRQVIDLATADAQPAPDGSGYAGFREAITIIRGLDNDVERPFYLPRLAMDSMVTVDPNFSTMVENTELGVSITVPPHTAMLNGEEFTGALSISEVPEALAPAPLPDFLGFSQLVTIQPVGVIFNEPVPITFRNIDGMPPGSETDIWSLDPDAGVFIVVGTGQVTADGEFIETIEGGVIAADWHGPVPPRIETAGAPVFFPRPVGVEPGSDTVNDGVEDPECPGASNGAATADLGLPASLIDGAVTATLLVPGCISGGEQRDLSLVYNSLTARPQLVVPVTSTLIGVTPNQVSIGASIGGLVGTPPVFFDTTSLSETNAFTAGITLDTRGFPTGITPYTLEVSTHIGNAGAGATTETTGDAVVYNRSQSSFGAGWGLLIDQQIIQASTDGFTYLHISGDGSSRLFRDGIGVDPFTIVSLGEETSFTTGSLFDAARGSILETFPGAGYRNVTDVTEVAAGELLVVTPFTNATEGRIYSPAEQTALTAYIENGGCAVILLDHDLNRASFAEATASLLEPFGLTGSNVSARTLPVDPVAHLLLSDSFGEVTRFDSPLGGFELNTAGTLAETVIPGNSVGTARVALIPEGSLGAGSGPVIFIGDTQSFSDTSGFGFASEPSHAALLLNSIAHCLRSQREPGEGTEFIGPPGEFSSLIRFDDGTFIRRTVNGVVYTFNSAGRILSSEDRIGNVITFTYDAAGNCTRVTDPYGKETRFEYTGGLLGSIINPGGQATTFEYDAEGNLVLATLPTEDEYRYEYDPEHLLTAAINPLGGRTEQRYTTSGRAFSATLPDGTTRQVRTQQGNVTDLGGTAATSADPAPLPDTTVSYTNGAGETQAVELDALGTATRLTDTDGLSRDTVRDANGLPTQVTHPSGRSFTATFDTEGRRTSLTDSATGISQTITYGNAFGNPTAVNNGQGATLTATYDSRNRPTEIVSFGGRRKSFTYTGTDPLPASETAPHGLVSRYTYNTSGNPTQIDEGDSITAISYTAAGDVGTVTDAEGRIFLNEYDSIGQLIRHELPGGISGSFTYNGLGQLSRLNVPSGAEYEHQYNSSGQFLGLVSPVGDALRVSYEYDAGRISRAAWGDGTDLQFTYQNGNLISLTAPTGTTQLTYSETTGLIDRVTAPSDFQLDFSYDTFGRLEDAEWSGATNGKVSRAYDAQGRIASVSVNDSIAHAISYDADDLITTVGPMTLSRSATTGFIEGTALGDCTDTRTYDAQGDLISLTARFGGNPIYTLTLTRDKIGRVLTKSETIQGTEFQTSYTYGAAGRLIRETRNGLNTDYTYDANGNRLTRTEGGGTTETGTYNAADQLMSYDGTSYAYDGCGRLNARGSDSFVYDVNGGLQSASLSSDLDLTYLHPVGAWRASESRNGMVQRQFVYLNEITVVGELDATGTARSVFGYATLAGAPDFMQREGRTYRIVSDDLGSPRLVVDCESGEVAQRMRHDAFGRVLEDNAQRFQPFGFSGGIYDPDTGWIRFGARDYDPFTARWTAPDPVLFEGSRFNLYEYAESDPVNLIDRTGTISFTPSGGSLVKSLTCNNRGGRGALGSLGAALRNFNRIPEGDRSNERPTLRNGAGLFGDRNLPRMPSNRKPGGGFGSFRNVINNISRSFSGENSTRADSPNTGGSSGSSSLDCLIPELEPAPCWFR